MHVTRNRRSLVDRGSTQGTSQKFLSVDGVSRQPRGTMCYSARLAGLLCACCTCRELLGCRWCRSLRYLCQRSVTLPELCRGVIALRYRCRSAFSLHCSKAGHPTNM